MITASEIYWILKLSDLRIVFFAFSVFFMGIALMSAIGWNVNEGICDDAAVAVACRKRFFYSMCLAFLLTIPAVFLPSTKQMAMIKVIPMIANNEAVKTMSTDAKEVYTLGIKAIKEQLIGRGQGRIHQCDR